MSRFNRTLRKFCPRQRDVRQPWSFEARLVRAARKTDTMSLDEILSLDL